MFCRHRRQRRDQGGRRQERQSVDPERQGEGFELDLPGGRRLYIPCGFDEAELARIVTVLSAC